MEVAFTDPDLDEIEQGNDGKLDHKLARAFRKAINFIRDAKDIRDVQTYPAFRFEKLQGARAHECSIRLNDQWRLIFQIEKEPPPTSLKITAIEDYH